MTELQTEGQGKSSIAPTFSKRGYNNKIIITTEEEKETAIGYRINYFFKSYEEYEKISLLYKHAW